MNELEPWHLAASLRHPQSNACIFVNDQRVVAFVNVMNGDNNAYLNDLNGSLN